MKGALIMTNFKIIYSDKGYTAEFKSVNNRYFQRNINRFGVSNWFRISKAEFETAKKEYNYICK